MSTIAASSAALDVPNPAIDWSELYGLGFSLIAIRAGSKLPAIQWAEFQTRRATMDEIEAWRRAGHNAGVVTGALSQLVVLDCDSAESVAEADALGTRNTVSVRTARGCHFYFRHPGFLVPNRTGFLPGMDVRGDGGFVVAPGSIHESGVAYAWINHPAWRDIAPPPEWLLERLRRQAIAKARVTLPFIAKHTAYGQRAMESELTILRNAPTGARNDHLNRSTFVLAQLAAGGQIDVGQAQSALRDAALSIGLEDGEIERTLESGWQAGLQEPRGKDSGMAIGQGPEILSARDLSEMKFAPLQWVLPGMLPEGLAILAGKPKFGKSFLTLQMAIAVATGKGKALCIEGIDVGDVLVCALEDSLRRLKERLERMYPFGNVPDRLHFATTWPRLGQGGIEELNAWCERHPETRLIIIDTWRAVKTPGNGRGSAYDEDATAAAPLLEFARTQPGLAVVVVHHVRKQESDDPFDMISGTHGLTGIFDTLMVLARHGLGAKLCAQGRDLDGYEKALERDRRTGGWNVRGDTVPLAKTGERQELLDLLARADGPLSLAELARSVGKKSDAVRHLLKSLIAEGAVCQPSHGQYAVTTQFPQNTQPGGTIEGIEHIEETTNAYF